MKQFTGFPAKMQFTPLPNFFFSTLLPQISDIAELKTTLHLLGHFTTNGVILASLLIGSC